MYVHMYGAEAWHRCHAATYTQLSRQVRCSPWDGPGGVDVVAFSPALSAALAVAVEALVDPGPETARKNDLGCQSMKLGEMKSLTRKKVLPRPPRVRPMISPTVKT